MQRLHCLLAAGLALTLLTFAATALAGRSTPALPADVPAAVRARLAPVVEQPSLATHVQGESFVARRDVFEYLIDHPEFATHVTQALKVARYRIWRTPTGLALDDGWGTVGSFETVYAAPGVRIMYVKGEYQQRILPNIRGQVVVRVDWIATPAPDGKSVIAPTVGAFVKLDSRVLALASALASSVATSKAEKEANRLVRVFEKTTRVLNDNPAGVIGTLRKRPETPRRELDEFARLLSLPALTAAPASR